MARGCSSTPSCPACARRRASRRRAPRRGTAILSVASHEDLLRLARAATNLTIVVSHGRVLNFRGAMLSMDALGLFKGGTSKPGTTRLRAAGKLNHAQLGFPVTDNFRTLAFCFPFMLTNSDDQFSDMQPHLHTRGGAAQLTMLEGLRDMCNAPFEVPADWCPLSVSGCGTPDAGPWLITFCAKCVPRLHTHPGAAPPRPLPPPPPAAAHPPLHPLSTNCGPHHLVLSARGAGGCLT